MVTGEEVVEGEPGQEHGAAFYLPSPDWEQPAPPGCLHPPMAASLLAQHWPLLLRHTAAPLALDHSEPLCQRR